MFIATPAPQALRDLAMALRVVVQEVMGAGAEAWAVMMATLEVVVMAVMVVEVDSARRVLGVMV